jgi:hypothetical protein
MPQARRSTRSSSRGGASFKEPAALKRLNQSLTAAQKALTELRSHAGRNATESTRTLHKGLGKFLSDARRDTGKFTTAIKRDFDQARKAASRTASGGTSRRSSSGGTSRRSTRRTTTRRSTRKSS